MGKKKKPSAAPLRSGKGMSGSDMGPDDSTFRTTYGGEGDPGTTRGRLPGDPTVQPRGKKPPSSKG